MWKEALFFLLDCVKYNCYQQHCFNGRSTRKKKMERKATAIKTFWCSLFHRIKSPRTMTSKASSETPLLGLGYGYKKRCYLLISNYYLKTFQGFKADIV